MKDKDGCYICRKCGNRFYSSGPCCGNCGTDNRSVIDRIMQKLRRLLK